MAMSDCEKCWETPCICGHNGYYVIYKNKIPHTLKIKSSTDIIVILNNLEQQLKEKDAEINRLRIQLARGHNVECSCSFCWGVPNENS